MAKPISFKDVEVEAPWEVERLLREQTLRHEAHIEESSGLSEDYLEQLEGIEAVADPEQRVYGWKAARRFGRESTAEGPDEIQFVH
jgi:hypothetical protein